MADAWGSEAGIWAALAAAAVVTYVPRALGVALSGRIDPNGAVFRWVGCVAYALLAGLIARMILLPVGPLQATGFAERTLAVAAALAAFCLVRRSVPVGVTVGTVVLILLSSGGRLF
ncbi:AzlD domain-containing protein [Azospirillum sp.]|uniref:AzlD domain-containing protein n=1 Tax=Azospirillum sp. TaxID=34012 RepID=UPI002D75BA80|nr:AzlD domain-containing protein [Azospirillum sp.]HYD65888.1 AzlD domain-containing protein [Azospirillum sp.]